MRVWGRVFLKQFLQNSILDSLKSCIIADVLRSKMAKIPIFCLKMAAIYGSFHIFNGDHDFNILEVISPRTQCGSATHREYDFAQNL